MKKAKGDTLLIKPVRENGQAAKYLGPALISITLLSLLPILYTIYISFTNYTIYTQGSAKFTGLHNYIEVLTGPFSKIFLPVFGWTIVFALVSTFGCFFVGLILAMLLNNSHMKEKGFYKGLLIIPWALPATIATLSWQGLLNTAYGAINTLLLNLHIISTPIPWLTNPECARAAVLFVNVWLGFPFMMCVCLGALSSIPKVYYEAASIDGASRFTQFRKITLPALAKTAYPLLISSFAFNFNNFNTIYLITKGLPPRVSTQWAGYTDILASSIYKLAVNFGKYNIGATLSVLVFIIVGTISFIQMKASGQFEEVD